MKRKKEILDSEKPNFILCDIGLQSAFAQMCQKFPQPTPSPENNSKDWIIIDNDTGEIINPQHTEKS